MRVVGEPLDAEKLSGTSCWRKASPWTEPPGGQHIHRVIIGDETNRLFHGAGRLTIDMPLVHQRTREPAILFVVGLALLVVSRIGAAEPGTWVMEVFPIFIAAPLLVATARRFPLTPLAYRLVFIHALILMLGGHYTYAKVPLGFWMEHTFHFSRNNYDRIGHFAQGFVPAIVTREILLRRSPVVRGKWLFFLVTAVCLAVSAGYELIEWAAAEIGGSQADAFLGTQGDVWDTQWDMLTALVGALVAQLTLSRRHDRELASLAETPT